VSNNIAEGSECGTTNELLAFICIARGCAGEARSILGDSSHVIDTARKSAARSVNRIMTAAYWLIGRRIVESEQKGDVRAGYGEELPKRLSIDSCCNFAFGMQNSDRWHFKPYHASDADRPDQLRGFLSRNPGLSRLAESADTLIGTIL